MKTEKASTRAIPPNTAPTGLPDMAESAVSAAVTTVSHAW
jgi:hypothetical protein